MDNSLLKADLLEIFDYVTDEEVNTEKKIYFKNKYNCIPDKIQRYENVTKTIDMFLIELFNNVEYSSKLKYILINKGRLAVQFIASVSIVVALFSLFVVPFFFISKDFDFETLRVISFILILCSSGLFLLSEQIFRIILSSTKPGDILRIITSRDEVVSISEPYQTVVNGKITSKTRIAYRSKKITVCENYIELFRTMKIKSITKYAVYFICLDYLINTDISESYREYLYEKTKNALEYLYAFRSKSEYILFSLFLVNLNLLDLDGASKYINEYLKLDKLNWYVNVWKYVIVFYQQNFI